MKIIVNSGFTNNNDTSRPVVRFNNGRSIQQLRLSQAIIPISYNNVTDDTNLIRFQEGSGPIKEAYIAPGIHSASTLASAVATAMTNAGTQPYTVTHDPVTNRLTLSAVNPFKLYYKSSTANRIIGLVNGKRLGTQLTTPRPIDLSGCKLILINVAELSNSDVIYAQRENVPIIDGVPVTVDYGEVLVHTNQDPAYVNVNDIVLSTMSISLLDAETLKPLNLQGDTFQLIFDAM